MNWFELTYHQDVAIIWLDQQGSKVNTILPPMLQEFDLLFDQLEADEQIRAMVISSAKKDFSKGVDVVVLYNLIEPGLAEKVCRLAQKILHRIEKSKKPIVAAIHGAAKGGGHRNCISLRLPHCYNICPYLLCLSRCETRIVARRWCYPTPA